MTAYVLNGVAFAKDTLPGYIPGRRVVINATVELSSAFQAAADALGGAQYSASAPVLQVEYRLDDGTLLGIVSSPGTVNVTVGTLQRSADGGARTISAGIPNYRTGAPDYLGTAFCVRFAKVGTLTVPVEEPPPPPTFVSGGLLARYYANTDMVGEPVHTVTAVPDFHYPNGTEPPGVPQDFSVRMTGSLKVPTTGAYRFEFLHDDGGRLYIDGRLAVDHWNGAAVDYTGTYNWTAGDFIPIWIEFQDYLKDATMHLHWTTPSSPGFIPIPAAQLFPTNGTERPPVEARPGVQARHYVETIARY